MQAALLYRKIAPEELRLPLFSGFSRRQQVNRILRESDGVWAERDVSFVYDWTNADYLRLLSNWKAILAAGGFVYGAFSDAALKGFASVDSTFFGVENRDLELTYLHVSAELRGQGCGRRLFLCAADWARARGAQRLYISSYAAAETQAFYRAMGCVPAAVPGPVHVAEEPCDVQLEYRL